MASTTVLGIDYPSENENPFHVTHATGMEEIDEWIRIAWEDALVLVRGGGTITLTGDTLEWTASILVESPFSGNVITIPASSTTILDGEIVSVNAVTRPIATETKSGLSKSTTGPGWDKTKLPLFKRVGSNVYVIRQSLGLEDVVVSAP